MKSSLPLPRTGIRSRLATTLLLAACAATPAFATLVDTGTPSGATPELALDAVDSYAGGFNVGANRRITGVSFYVDGGAAGETFTLALYDDAPGHRPGNLLYSATASYAASGWNGLDQLVDWFVTPGSDVWAAIEVGFADTLGSASVTGALLPTDAPAPLASTAFSSGAGYGPVASPLGFGLQVTAVPEPASLATALLALCALGTARVRRAQR